MDAKAGSPGRGLGRALGFPPLLAEDRHGSRSCLLWQGRQGRECGGRCSSWMATQGRTRPKAAKGAKGRTVRDPNPVDPWYTGLDIAHGAPVIQCHGFPIQVPLAVIETANGHCTRALAVSQSSPCGVPIRQQSSTHRTPSPSAPSQSHRTALSHYTLTRSPPDQSHHTHPIHHHKPPSTTPSIHTHSPLVYIVSPSSPTYHRRHPTASVPHTPHTHHRPRSTIHHSSPHPRLVRLREAAPTAVPSTTRPKHRTLVPHHPRHIPSHPPPSP